MGQANGFLARFNLQPIPILLHSYSYLRYDALVSRIVDLGNEALVTDAGFEAVTGLAGCGPVLVFQDKSRAVLSALVFPPASNSFATTALL